MVAATTDVAVRFLADTSSVQAAAGKVEGTGSKIKGWAKGVGLAIGGAFAIDQVKQFIGAASELQDQLAASQTIFGAAAGTVEKFGDRATDAFGISKSAAIGAANTFATFGKGAGLVGEDLAGFSTDLTGLSGDLASFRGTSTEQAIEAVGAALRGETEPIRAYGVMLDDATLKNRAMAMGLISTTKDALTPQQKTLAAQAEILAQTTDAQGDFQRTGDSAANQQKKLSANIENTQAALGTALLPVLSAILPVLSAFAGFIQQNADWLVPLVGIVAAFAAAIWLVNIAMNANPIMLVVIALAALAAGLIWAYQNVDWFRAAVDVMAQVAVAAFTWLWDTIQAVFAWVADHWKLLLAILTGPIGAAVALIVTHWDTIKAGAQAVLDWIMTTFQTIGTWIVAPFNWAWGEITRIMELVKDVFGKAIGFVKDAWNVFARFWNGIELEIPGIEGPGPLPDIPGMTIGLPDLPQFAKGGIVTRATVGLLGEKGPEAVIPLDQWPGAGNTTINIQVTTTGLGADTPAIQRGVVSALQKYVRRNGPLPGIAAS